MKNSKKYAKEIGKLYRSLKKKHPKAKVVEYEEPVEALVYAVVSEDVRSSVAKAILKRIKGHFIDLNDLRVSRQEEICEALGSDTSDAKRRARVLTDVLNAVFYQYDRVCLEDLKELGKRQARKELDKLEPASSFVINYCFLTAFGGHAIPLTPNMIEYLKTAGMVDPKAKDDDIEGFLERQISASDGYEFYSLLRRESDESVKKKVKKTSKKKAEKESDETVEKKAVKKTKTAKKTNAKSTAKVKKKTTKKK